MADTTKTPAPPKVATAGNAAPAAAQNSQPANTTPAATAAAPATAPARKKRVSTVPADETNEQKVSRLGKARLGKAVKSIRQLGNLAAYKPTAEQVKKISDRLTLEVTTVANRLTATKPAEDSEDFSL